MLGYSRLNQSPCPCPISEPGIEDHGRGSRASAVNVQSPAGLDHDELLWSCVCDVTDDGSALLRRTHPNRGRKEIGKPMPHRSQARFLQTSPALNERRQSLALGVPINGDCHPGPRHGSVDYHELARRKSSVDRGYVKTREVLARRSASAFASTSIMLSRHNCRGMNCTDDYTSYATNYVPGSPHNRE